jgi:hypothetical protein
MPTREETRGTVADDVDAAALTALAAILRL